jgi:hypothetical protein
MMATSSKKTNASWLIVKLRKALRELVTSASDSPAQPVTSSTRIHAIRSARRAIPSLQKALVN